MRALLENYPFLLWSLQGFQGAVAGTRALSEKAMAGATAAAARADECDALLQKAETRMGQRLDKAVQDQVLYCRHRSFLPAPVN